MRGARPDLCVKPTEPATRLRSQLFGYCFLVEMVSVGLIYDLIRLFCQNLSTLGTYLPRPPRQTNKEHFPNIQNHGTPILRAPAPRALTVVLGCLPHTAPDVELILGLLRCCGFKIRQADPASLQEILKTVALTQVCFHVPPPYSQC